MTRKELMRIMPANAADLAAAERMIEMGYPAVTPVMRDMVNLMRVAVSPVADAFAVFFGRLGESAVDAIDQGLMHGNCWLRHRIFTQVFPLWPPNVIRQLTNTLKLVATQPDAYDNDLLCVDLLIQQRLADPQWLGQWIEFKKERWAVRNELMVKVEARLKSVPQDVAPGDG